jgi:hypothetical protein
MAGTAQAQNPDATLTLPLTRKVFQRNAANYALVPISGTCANLNAPVVEVRCTVMSGGTGTSQDWRPLTALDGRTPLTVDGSAAFQGALSVAAGGWYTIEARVRDGDTVIAQSAVDRIGVGEVFITAGQSNSANFGEFRTTAQDDRISSWLKIGLWWHGDDPQNTADGPGGSPWPTLGDTLVRELHVPVAFLCFGDGGTLVADWLPGSTTETRHYQRLLDGWQENRLNGIRAVLWHQGEADVKVQTTRGDYAAQLSSLIQDMRTDTGQDVPWFVAQASYVPLYQINTDPNPAYHTTQEALDQQMATIRGAQGDVAGSSLADNTFQGPTTDDLLTGTWRYQNIHFRVAGLREHGWRWADVLLPFIKAQVATPPTITFTTPVDGSTVNVLPDSLGGRAQTSVGAPDPVALDHPQIEAEIIRQSDGQYWDGSEWTALETWLPSTVNNNQWSITATLPPASSLTPGAYRLVARLRDASGASATTAETAIAVNITRSRTVIITYPLNGAGYPTLPTDPAIAAPPLRYNSVATAYGTANDDSGHLPQRVTIRLRRTLSDGTISFWAGDGVWDASYDATRDERPATGTLNWRIVLPSLNQGFGAGSYLLRATAVDSTGRTRYQEVSFSVLDAYNLAGRVAGSNSVGIANVTVTRRGYAFPGTATTVTTNGAGYYLFSTVPTGTQTLTCSLGSYQFQPTAQTVTVVAGDVTNVNFTGKLGYSLAGRVTTMDAAGNAVGLAGVDLTATATGVQQVAHTNSAGYYTLSNLPSGSYTVTPNLAGYNFAPPAANVTIAGSNVSGVNFTTGYSISGRIATLAGMAVPGVVVTCTSSISGTAQTVQTDSNGYYRFVNVLNGSYVLSGDAGCTPAQRSVVVQNASVSGQNFTQSGP